MITIIDQKIESAYRCSLRWKCTTEKVLYFNVYRGLNPADKQLFARTSDVAIGNVSLTTPADGGDIYISIEAMNVSNEVVDKLEFRITPGDISTYLKYRKYFEDNFYKASLTKAAGTSVAILQRKFTGVPCTSCANPLSGEPEDPDCNTCFGTGYDGGFYTPIISPALRGAAQEQSDADSQKTRIRVVQKSITIPAYPKLYPKDYLVDLQDYTFYEVLNQGEQTMQYDHQRLASTVYQTRRLASDHPVVVNYKIDAALTSISSVGLIENNILTVTGIKVKPYFGRMCVVIYNKDHADPFSYDEEVYYYQDLYTIKDGAIQFEIDPRFFELNCGYKITLNNLNFEGDVVS